MTLSLSQLKKGSMLICLSRTHKALVVQLSAQHPLSTPIIITHLGVHVRETLSFSPEGFQETH